jgi:hypothetical protein
MKGVRADQAIMDDDRRRRDEYLAQQADGLDVEAAGAGARHQQPQTEPQPKFKPTGFIAPVAGF